MSVEGEERESLRGENETEESRRTLREMARNV